jgi:hypothetical protein
LLEDDLSEALRRRIVVAASIEAEGAEHGVAAGALRLMGLAGCPERGERRRIRPRLRDQLTGEPEGVGMLTQS